MKSSMLRALPLSEQAVTVFIQEENQKAQYAFGKEQVLLQHEKSKFTIGVYAGWLFLHSKWCWNALLV